MTRSVVQDQDARAAQRRQQARFHGFDKLPGSQATRPAQVGQFPVAAQKAAHVPAARVGLGGHGERGAGRLPAAAQGGLQAKAALIPGEHVAAARLFVGRAAWPELCARRLPGAVSAACRCAGGCVASASAPGAGSSLACPSRRGQAPPFCQRAAHAGGTLLSSGEHLRF